MTLKERLSHAALATYGLRGPLTDAAELARDALTEIERLEPIEANQREATQAWCDGFNAGVQNARENVYWRRVLRCWKWYARAWAHPELRGTWWRWWKLWPDNQ